MLFIDVDKLSKMTCSKLNQFTVVSNTRYIIFHLVFALIILSISDFLDEEAIVAQTKLGQHELAMEGMLVTICNTLDYIDYDSALSAITTLSRDQATLSKLKEDSERRKNGLLSKRRCCQA